MNGSIQNDLKKSDILKQGLKQYDSTLFNKIKGIKTPVKNELLITLLDGEWHSETELIRIAKREHKYAGPVLVGTMINSLNSSFKTSYLKRKIIGGEIHFKISDNYVGLTRAAYTRYQSKIVL
jgi:hypothetical protein